MRHWPALIVLGMLFGGSCLAAIPTEVLILEEDEHHTVRLELTGGAKVYLRSGDDLYEGTATETGDQLRFHFEPPATAWAEGLVLTNNDGKWLDASGAVWAPRRQLLNQDPTWTKVQITLVDQHHKAVTGFRYNYAIDWEQGWWDPLLGNSNSPQPSSGRIEFRAPPDCEIHLYPDHPDLAGGYGTSPLVQRKGGQVELEAIAKRGITVTGKVVADATGKAISAASIAPQIPVSPVFLADKKRATRSNADGSFALRGVHPDLGIVVDHDDYLDNWLDLNDANEALVVRLKAGAQIRGVVLDSKGRPLAGVGVGDDSKSTQTDSDGNFVLEGLRHEPGEAWSLEFYKEGYRRAYFKAKEVDPGGVTIHLSPLPTLRGRVVYANGSPAENYKLIVGPGRDPGSYSCEEQEINHAEGRFELQLDAAAPVFELGAADLPPKDEGYWVGVVAKGAMPWHGGVSTSKLTGGDFVIELESGHSLAAKINAPRDAIYPLEINLRALDYPPEDDGIGFLGSDSTAAGRLHSHALELKQGEELHVDNLRDGNYQLHISGKKVTPYSQTVEIRGADLDLGAIQLRGTGSISGTARKQNLPWKFANGGIHPSTPNGYEFEPKLSFKTNAEGEFHVEGVPVGLVDVSFGIAFSADITGSVIRQARVSEGENTEIRFDGIKGLWAQPVELLFAGEKAVPAFKGSREVDNVTTRAAMFRFELSALDDSNSSAPAEANWYPDDRPSGAIIPDLSPGRWQIRVYDWLGSTGFDDGQVAEVTIELKGDERPPIQIALGDRALTGRVTSKRETLRHTKIIAIEKATGRINYSRCDAGGAFIVRYLPAGTYSVHAHDNDGGWCDLGDYDCTQPVTDCHDHQLAPGGDISGHLGPGLAGQADLDVTATGPDGIRLPVDEIGQDGRFRFGNLRPGRWIIKVRIADKKPIAHTIEVRPGSKTDLPVIIAP